MGHRDHRDHRGQRDTELDGVLVTLMRGGIAAVSLAMMTACGSVMIGGSPPATRTRAERTDYRETSHYADVVAFIDSLKGRPGLTFGSIGRTSEGREIPYVIASRPQVSTPDEARKLGRPVVYVQGNIHAGEIEGKEALLSLLRDLSNPRRPNALDSVILIAVPIYNADGNEKFASQETNRGSQNGPEQVGVRPNAQGLDLNRDYIKAEAPETRASLAMFNAWNPDVFVDLHTTNGSYHGYALTYAPPLHPSSPLGAFTRDSLLPVLRERMRSRRRFETFDYGDFISADTLSKGWVTFDSRPRFGTNYYGLRGGISILSEAYSHDPMQRRVASTYAFVGEILSLVGERALEITSLTQAVRSSAIRGNAAISPHDGDYGQYAFDPHRAALRSTMIAAPELQGVVAEIVERTGDSARTQPGVPKGRRRTGRFTTVQMSVYERFAPTLSEKKFGSYFIARGDTQVVGALRRHGVSVSTMSRDWRGPVHFFRVDSAAASPRPFQGHREMRIDGRWIQTERTIPAGSFLVRTNQPLGLLAFYMLEPQSDDGLVTWNYFDAVGKPGAEFPVLRTFIPLPPLSQ